MEDERETISGVTESLYEKFKESGYSEVNEEEMEATEETETIFGISEALYSDE